MSAADPFQPMSMPLTISAIVAVVLLATHAGMALAAVRGIAGDDGEPRGAGKRFFLQTTLVLLAVWTMAPAGLTMRTLASVALGHVFLILAVFWIWRELAQPTRGSGTRFSLFTTAFLLSCLSLVVTKLVHKDEVRHAWLLANPPKPKPEVAVAPATTPPTAIPSNGTPGTTTPPTGATATATSAAADPVFAKGEKVFKTTCIVCHALENRLVGPPIREIAEAYKGNPDGIAAWAKAPGKKRPDYPPMIPVPLPDEDLKAAGVYMLKIAEKK
jgi:cytochrome c